MTGSRRSDRDRPPTTFLASSATCSRRWANHPAPVDLLLAAMLLDSKVALMPKDSWARLRGFPKSLAHTARAARSSLGGNSGEWWARCVRTSSRSSTSSVACHCSPLNRLNQLKICSTPAVAPGVTKYRSATGSKALAGMLCLVCHAAWDFASAACHACADVNCGHRPFSLCARPWWSWDSSSSLPGCTPNWPARLRKAPPAQGPTACGAARVGILPTAAWGPSASW